MTQLAEERVYVRDWQKSAMFDARDVLREVLVRAFPDRKKEITDQPHGTRLDHVELDYIGYGEWLVKGYFQGMHLKTEDAKCRMISRKVMVDKDGYVDLNKVREKFDELRKFAEEVREARNAATMNFRSNQAKEQALKEYCGIESPDRVRVEPSGECFLTLKLSGSQVARVMERVREMRQADSR